ncbi:uncharacterized protein LOC117341608 [Pecten maximus]|uniref:uncharacterized protein LOC117341608 n=1 Tax=Pecten maximus TaxID=6579 RepID=UPI001458471F|nr:uncharacterized protein LOC117341608 [Pecten maximus]
MTVKIYEKITEYFHVSDRRGEDNQTADKLYKDTCNNNKQLLVQGRPNVRISKQQLEAVLRKSGGSPTYLARHLLMVFFDQDTLAKSCARGTSNRPALDKEILSAILE